MPVISHKYLMQALSLIKYAYSHHHVPLVLDLNIAWSCSIDNTKYE